MVSVVATFRAATVVTVSIPVFFVHNSSNEWGFP